MTTIIVVAIVALVFFVAVSVAAFMTWRQETRMRTDSLRGIEISLTGVLDEITERRTGFIPYHDPIKEEEPGRRGNKRSRFARNSKWQTDNEEDEDIEVTVFRPSEFRTKRREEKASPAACDAEQLIEAFEERSAEAEEEKKTEPADALQEETKAAGDDSSKEKLDLSFIDIEDLFELDKIIFDEDRHDRSSDYNTGKSGKKYTAEELESLIKE